MTDHDHPDGRPEAGPPEPERPVPQQRGSERPGPQRRGSERPGPQGPEPRWPGPQQGGSERRVPQQRGSERPDPQGPEPERRGDAVPAEDLGYEAAELLSLSSGEAEALNGLAELAVRQVPGCAAAHAAIWRDGELARVAATHPETAELSQLQLHTGRGPMLDAMRDGTAVTCTDTLTENRWPQWAEAALLRGVRCAVDLVRQAGPVTMVLALSGVRPGVLNADAVPIAEMLTQLGGTALANTLSYDAAQRTATQLKDSVAARAVTDQAKGILMHALGCDADQALAYLRRESQRRHIKVTEVAARVIETYTGPESSTGPGSSTGSEGSTGTEGGPGGGAGRSPGSGR